MRLGNERRRAASAAAAATTMTTAAAAAATTTTAKGRPSDDEDIADLLLSFSRAPTKQVREPMRGERAIKGARARSAGGGFSEKNHDRKTSFEGFFFLPSLLL